MSSDSASRMAGAAPGRTDPDCLFCKIVRGQVPCYKVFENDDCVAFLDLFPATRAHTLVVPKGHHATTESMTGAEMARVFACVPAVAAAVKQAVGAPACNLLINDGSEAGQLIPHLHLHIVPRHAGDALIRHPKSGPRLEPEQADPLVRAVADALQQRVAAGEANQA